MPTAIRQSRGEATRADIIQVARRLFSEYGYHRTGLSDIQSATGLTKGAFYHHFRSKEDLALGVLEEARAEYARYLVEPAMQAGSPRERLEALFDGVLALNRRPEWCNCQMMATFSAEATGTDERFRAAVQDLESELFAVWRDCIAEARRLGELPPSLDPAASAAFITSTITGLLLARKLGTLQADPKAIIEKLKEALRTVPDA